MHVKTLILSHEPLKTYENIKPAAKRDDEYFKELIGSFDLGEVHYASHNDYKEILTTINPIIVIVPGSYYAHELKEFKNDVVVYELESPSWVFYRKAESEKRKVEQREKLESIANLVKHLRKDQTEEHARKFATMGYKEMYEMIKQGIISDNKELSKQAWDLVLNAKKGDFVWMRVNLIVDAWQSSDAQGKYTFLTLAMKDHIDNCFARELAIHTDEDGIQYRQYEFIYPSGFSTKVIRRIPIPTKEMDKSAYESLLYRYESPNAPQLLLEVGQVKEMWKEETLSEAEKIYTILKMWKDDPTKTMRQLNIINQNGEFHNEPLRESDVTEFKRILKAWNLERYQELFG